MSTILYFKLNDTIQCDPAPEMCEYIEKPKTLDNIQLIKIHAVTGIS